MAEPPYGHESSAIAVRRVLEVAAIIAVTVIVLVSVIHFIMGEWVVPQHSSVVARPAAIPPAPRLQAQPDNDLAALHAQKQALLSTWGWSDPQRDFAHIPVERAMTLYERQHAAEKANAPATQNPQEIGR